jgi:hypothetical protein
MTEDAHVVVCGTTPRIKNSIRLPCARCGTSVWVAPSSRKIPDAVLVCFPCAEHMMNAPDVEDVILSPLTVDQQAELAEYERDHPDV